jgi:hypothetical protein
MKTKSQHRYHTAIERKEEAVRKRAKVLLDDTSHDWLRTPSTQRSIVGLYVLIIAAMTAVWLYASPLAAIGALTVWLIALLALRISVRTQADLPDYVLDERQRAERNQSYVDAFRVVAGVFFLGAAIAFWYVVFTDAYIGINYRSASALFWGITAFLAGAPSLALALRQSSRNRTEHPL